MDKFNKLERWEKKKSYNIIDINNIKKELNLIIKNTVNSQNRFADNENKDDTCLGTCGLFYAIKNRHYNHSVTVYFS